MWYDACTAKRRDRIITTERFKNTKRCRVIITGGHGEPIQKQHTGSSRFWMQNPRTDQTRPVQIRSYQTRPDEISIIIAVVGENRNQEVFRRGV